MSMFSIYLMQIKRVCGLVHQHTMRLGLLWNPLQFTAVVSVVRPSGPCNREIRSTLLQCGYEILFAKIGRNELRMSK